MAAKEIKIKNVIKGSVADEAGIETGDVLLAIDGNNIKDIFDYKFYTAAECIIVEIVKNNGECWEIDIEKGEYEDLGLEFEEELIDKARSCRNKCIFCFIDQLPEGMRNTLYFKDDDSRMSFLSGNYITLTNMNDDDIRRINRYRMSPVNISVHTTDPQLRQTMLRNKKAGDVLKYINSLVENGIEVNTQIVLCRGINDGNALEKTITDLGRMYPGIHSISVVPVGITRYRENNGLYPLEPFDKESSLDVVKLVERLQKQFKKDKGSNIVYLADEFYLMAGRKVPGFRHYEDFPQIENGVGLISSFKHELSTFLDGIKPDTSADHHVAIVTGKAAYEFIKECADLVRNKFTNIKANVFGVENRFFGRKVTVAGLVTGQDIIFALRDRVQGDYIMIPSSMLKHGETVFLDDITVDDIERELGVKVCVVYPGGREFVEKIIGL